MASQAPTAGRSPSGVPGRGFKKLSGHLGGVELAQLQRGARRAARRSRPCPPALRSTAPCRASRTSRQVSARSSQLWVRDDAGESTTGPSRGCGCSGARRPSARRRAWSSVRMPADTATLSPVRSRTRGTSSSRRAMVRSSGPRTASTMQNSDAPRRRGLGRGAPGPRRCRGRGWPSPACRSATTASRSGSPRGIRPSWPTGCPRPRRSGPHQASRTSWANERQPRHRLVGHHREAAQLRRGREGGARRAGPGGRGRDRAPGLDGLGRCAGAAPGRLGRAPEGDGATRGGSEWRRRAPAHGSGLADRRTGTDRRKTGSEKQGATWRGTSRPNPSTRPSWPGRAPSSTRRSCPLETLELDYDDLLGRSARSRRR